GEQEDGRGPPMNLAIFLPNWVGDAVMATPAVRAIRQHFTGARVLGLMRPYVAGVFEGAPWFDETILTLKRSWSLGPDLATAWKLRRRRIDLAVLLPNSFRPALIARLGGARRVVGYA